LHKVKDKKQKNTCLVFHLEIVIGPHKIIISRNIGAFKV